MRPIAFVDPAAFMGSNRTQKLIYRCPCRRREHHQPQLHCGLASGGGSPAVRFHERRGRNADQGIALELAPCKIRVNAIAPGHTETEGNVAAGPLEGGAGAGLAAETPLGRLGRVTDIAPLAVFLASD